MVTKTRTIYPPSSDFMNQLVESVLQSVSAASVARPSPFAASLNPEQVIFNPPATIVYWKDGTKTVARCDNDEFSEEFGFAMACMRKIFGTRNAFKAQFKDAYRPYLKKKKEKKPVDDTPVAAVLPDSNKSDAAPVSLNKMLRDLAGDDSVGVVLRITPKE